MGIATIESHKDPYAEKRKAFFSAAEKSIAAKGRTSFYAVRHGRVPGVYRTYRELQENIGGYKFAAFKKFDNDDDAWKFVNGESKLSTHVSVRQICVFYAFLTEIYFTIFASKNLSFFSWQETFNGFPYFAHRSLERSPISVSISKDPGRTATFYAVQVGRKPGVFRSWDECVKQIEGMPNAVFKKFAEEKAARDFVEAAG